MKIARHWTRVREEFDGLRVTARGWSDDSVDSAREKARDIARRVAERIVNGFTQKNRYLYGDRPLPEPVIREFAGGVVTRNSYGALILNTDRLMFVDVDRPAQSSSSNGGGGGFFASLFARPKPPAPAPPDPLIAAMKNVAARHNLSGRLYETAAGYRLMITSAPFKAGTNETEALLAEFRADPLYMRLCRLQESFRARLTPKPFRIDSRNPPVEFPFETAADQAKHDRWVAEYNKKSAQFSTCRLLENLGRDVAPEFSELIEYHDLETKAASGLPLA